MRRLNAASIVALAVLAACGVRRHAPDPGLHNASVAPQLAVYHELGMLAGPVDFPAVARFTSLAGPSDSTHLILSMSMPNSALQFQRDDSTFSASYRVRASFTVGTVALRTIDRSERVRVLGVAETMRTDETIRFQDMVTLTPGRYIVRLQVADTIGARGFHAIDTVDVPQFTKQGVVMAEPLLVHDAIARAHTAAHPNIVINARNTLAYGGGNPRYYLEMYGAVEPMVVRTRIVDENNVPLWHVEVPMASGDATLRHTTIDIPADSLPIGKMWIETSVPGGVPHRAPLMVAISEQTMVFNFDEVLRFLRHIAAAPEVDALRKTTGAGRNAVWERFWARRDSNPATSRNEVRDEFFERIRTANDQFAEPGRRGWDTPRGTLLMVLGPPDFETERVLGRQVGAQSTLFEWVYESLPGGRIVFQFYDRSGFGRYELTPASESAFNTIAARMRPRS